MTDSENKTHLDEDYLDVTDEFESDDLNNDNDDDDFDGDNEDGIFAPNEPAKKRSSLKLMGVVIVLAFLSGGAFYFYNQMDSSPSNELAPPVDTASVSDTIPAIPQEDTVPAIPTLASDFETPAVPEQNAPSEEIVMDQSGQHTAPVLPDVQNVTDNAEGGISEVGSNPETSPPLISETDQPPVTAEAEIVSPKPEAAPSLPATEATAPVVPQEPLIEVAKESEVAAQPDAAVLTPLPKADLPVPAKKNELEAARETVNVAEKKAPPKTVYFDSPKGKALTDIPPPSINPMKEPGESIIIVHKGTSAPSQMIVERGDQSDFVESRLVNANRASNLGSNDAALGFYDELIKKSPSDPRVLMGRAVTLQKLGENQKAIEAYRDVLQVDSNNPEAITNLMGLIGKTQPAVALQNLLELREKYPRNAAVAAQLGVAYTQAGNPQDGLRYLNMAAGLQPENPLHFFNMAVIYERLKDREKAIKYYEQALDIYAVNGSGTTTTFSREQIYDRLSALRGN